jgi:hypothetical protein
MNGRSLKAVWGAQEHLQSLTAERHGKLCPDGAAMLMIDSRIWVSVTHILNNL